MENLHLLPIRTKLDFNKVLLGGQWWHRWPWSKFQFLVQNLVNESVQASSVSPHGWCHRPHGLQQQSDVSNSAAVVQTLNSFSSDFEPPKLVLQRAPASAFKLFQSRALWGLFAKWKSGKRKKLLANTGNPAQKLMKHPRSCSSKVMSVLSRKGKDIAKGFSLCAHFPKCLIMVLDYEHPLEPWVSQSRSY